MVIERRQSERIGVAWKATVTRLNGEQIPGSTDNLSHTGVNVILSRELVVGEPLELQLISRCSGNLSRYLLKVAVVHIKPLPKNLGYAVGVRLIEPNVQYQNAFANLINRNRGEKTA